MFLTSATTAQPIQESLDRVYHERHQAKVPEPTADPLLQAPLLQAIATAGEAALLFSNTFASSPIGMTLLGTDGTYLGVNSSFCEIVGYCEQELIGATVAQLTHPDDLEAESCAMQQMLDGAIDIYRGETRLTHKLGHEVWVLSTITTHRDMTGSVLYFVTQAVDMSDRIQKQEAERASQAKTEFLSRMSHELRTPLNAMLGFAQLLEMDDLTPAQAESTAHIMRAGRHLLNIINEVLDIARIEEGHLSISVEPIRVSDVVRESVQLMQPLADQQDMALRADMRGLGDRHVKADRQRLQQVLINLLSNAIKYSRRGATVRLTCGMLSTGQLRVAVSDRGVGIPADKMASLFKPFERLGAEERHVEGTGLGLALSRRLTEAMGGVIGVKSTVGKGSRFWVDLPMIESQIERFDRLSVSSLVPVTERSPLHVRSLLYVEDNLSNLRLVNRIVELRPDVKLFTATSGAEGLRLAHERRPDLILLDLHLADMSGYDILQRLVASPEVEGVPVVVLSADATRQQIERFMSAGVYSYLTKPLNIKRFLRLLDEAFHPA